MKSKWWLLSLLACLALASLSPLASSSPDGLERVADDQGFIGMAREAPFHIIADYVFPGIHNETLAAILAGIAGTLVLFVLVYLISLILVSRKRGNRSET